MRGNSSLWQKRDSQMFDILSTFKLGRLSQLGSFCKRWAALFLLRMVLTRTYDAKLTASASGRKEEEEEEEGEEGARNHYSDDSAPPHTKREREEFRAEMTNVNRFLFALRERANRVWFGSVS
jgi:hypothetical protein